MHNIYLIKSDSFYLLNNKISELTEGIEDITKFNLDDIELSDVVSDGSYGSLFNDKKALIISNVKYFGGKFSYEEESEMLLDYLSKIDDSTTVILICNELAKDKSITKKAIALGGQIIDLTSLKEEDIDAFINSVLDKNQIRMNKDTISGLLTRVGNNIDLFFSEVFKISIINKNITNEDLMTYSSYDEKDVTFDFSDAVVKKDFNKAFELLDILLAKDTDLNGLVGLLAGNYTTMYLIKDAVNSGLSDEAIEQVTGFKSGRIYINKKLGRIYTLEELQDIIVNLSIVDKKIKTGSNPVYVFKEFLLNI